MAHFSIDINKTRDIGFDIVSLSKAYINNINELVGLLSKIDQNGTWTGAAAKSFVEKVKADKVSYVEFGKELSKLGNIIISSADKLEREQSKSMV